MTRRSRLAWLAGLTVFLTAMGATTGYALWRISASTSAQVRAATVALAASGTATAPLSGEFLPGEALTAPVILTNSGTASLRYTAAVTSTEGTLAPASVSLVVWKVANASDCSGAASAPVGAWSGTLAGFSAAPDDVLPSGAAQILCVRTAETATQVQGDKTVAADLVFTGSNGWQSSGTIAMSLVYSVPAPEGPVICSNTSSQKTVTLGWLPVPGVDAYRLYFAPAVTPAQSPAYLEVTSPSATISGENFDTVVGSVERTGSVSIRAVIDGWESSGLDRIIHFEPKSNGSNDKISCTAFG